MATKTKEKESGAPTPMMAQYLALKAEATDCLLFYRMGDFFELFFDDARIAAQCLDIALTARGEHDGAPVPMCGVPFHAAESYLARLIRAGHRVAIAEQTESPAEAKKRGSKSVVSRAIVRVVTAGTLTEEALLDSRAANWLVAVAKAGDRLGLAAADISTGRFELSSVAEAALGAELARLSAAEIVAPDGIEALAGFVVQQRKAGFDSVSAERRLKERFGVATLDGFGQFDRAALAAAGGLLAYLDEVARESLPFLQPPERRAVDGHMMIDAATRESLELTVSAGGTRAGSLLAAVDRTVTGAGARLLAADVGAPLLDRALIEERLDLVALIERDAG
ncbi:MAG TPA: DNA mismatch repair protein MutS, partial [Allosphingosinicella sp.]